MIQHALCNSFLLDLVAGLIHHAATDDYRMALYVESADLGENTERYQTVGEVNALGYQPGGTVLQGRTVRLVGRLSVLTWASPIWPVASITARGGLIYNYTKGNRAVAVVDMGQNYTSTNGAFVVNIPENLIEIGVAA